MRKLIKIILFTLSTTTMAMEYELVEICPLKTALSEMKGIAHGNSKQEAEPQLEKYVKQILGRYIGGKSGEGPGQRLETPLTINKDKETLLHLLVAEPEIGGRLTKAFLLPLTREELKKIFLMQDSNNRTAVDVAIGKKHVSSLREMLEAMPFDVLNHFLNKVYMYANYETAMEGNNSARDVLEPYYSNLKPFKGIEIVQATPEEIQDIINNKDFKIEQDSGCRVRLFVDDTGLRFILGRQEHFYNPISDDLLNSIVAVQVTPALGGSPEPKSPRNILDMKQEFQASNNGCICSCCTLF